MFQIRFRYRRYLFWCPLLFALLVVMYELNVVLKRTSGYDDSTILDPIEKFNRMRLMQTMAHPPPQARIVAGHDEHVDNHNNILTTTIETITTLDAFKAEKLKTLYSQINVTEQKAKFPAFEIGNYVLLPTEVCQDAETIDLLIVVHTSPVNVEKRRRIRNSFAKRSLFLPFQIRVVFLLGRPEDESVRPVLHYEHALYNDTVMGDFHDDYHNLTLKGVMGLRWTSQYCDNARFILKIDDDVVIDTYKLLNDYIPHMNGKKKSIFCNVWRKNMRIERSGKWGLPLNIFKGMNKFPYYYCSGYTVLLSSDLIAPMFAAAKITPFFWIDDLFVFGMLPKIVGNITYYDYQISRNMTLAEADMEKCVDTRGLKCPFFSTLVKENSYWALWKKIQDLHVIANHWKPLQFFEE